MRSPARWLVVLALAAAAVVVAFRIEAATPPRSAALDDLFKEGVKAYDAQDYDGAIARFDQLLRFRAEHPAVEYNLGNAYYKKRDYGRAVLHWERALRLDPDDDDTRANLALVRTLLVDEVTAPETALATLLDRASRLLTLDGTTVLAFVAYQVFGLALLVAILRGGPLRRVAVGLAVLAGLLLALVTPLFVLQVRAHADRSRLVVLQPAVEARSGPGEQYTTVFTVHEGLVVRSRGSASGWEWLELPNGLSGWVPAADVERL